MCLISLVIWEWFQKAPIIDVRLFKTFNFASANVMMFMLGILLFSSLVLMPQFLQTLLGYTSELAGLALSAGGLILLFEMPLIGQLTRKIQARRLIAFGWLALSIAMFYSTRRIDLQMSFTAATWLRIAQVIGLGFLFVPINLAAYVGIAPEKNNAVAGIVNFMRNMGSSVGTSLVTTVIARRSQFHQLRLVEQARIDNPNFANTVQGLTQHFARGGLRRHEASATAYASIYRSMQAQAASLAYIDTFMVLCVCAAIMFFVSFFLKKNDLVAAVLRLRNDPLVAQIPGFRKGSVSMIKIITIEREYGCGGGEIAQLVAKRLGWKLWDQALTEEIARLAKCPTTIVQDREERPDPLYYRLFKSFLRGSYEGSLNAPKLNLVDSETILTITRRVVESAAKHGNGVIVGRGSQQFLKDRPETLRVFLYAPRENKIRRLVARGKTEKEAEELIDTVDNERADFIKKYFNVEWPDRAIYHAMINTSCGDEATMRMIVNFMDAYAPCAVA